MTLFQAESLIDAGEYEDVRGRCRNAVGGAAAARHPRLQAQVRILMAKARHGLGMLEEAAAEARAAADLTEGEGDVEINVKARQALIAALADSGRLEEAWAESLIMAEVISGEVDDQLVGKAYWVIGNVAFLCNKVDEGLAVSRTRRRHIFSGPEPHRLGEIQQRFCGHAARRRRRRCRHASLH